MENKILLNESDRIELVSNLGYICAILENELDSGCIIMQNFYKLQDTIHNRQDICWEVNER